MDICKSCLEYQIRNDLIESEICPECGQKMLVWKKDNSGCFYSQCSNCPMFVAVDMNTPCELDTRFREDIRLEIYQQETYVANIVIMKLAKILRISAVQTKKAIKEGYTTLISPYEIDEVIRLLDENGISYITNKRFEPMKEYGFFKECSYPYSRMNEFKKKYHYKHIER